MKEDGIWLSPRSSNTPAAIAFSDRFDSCPFRISSSRTVTEDRMENQMRNIPQVEKLLQDERISTYTDVIGRGAVTEIIRKVLEKYREKAKAGGEIRPDSIVASVEKNCVLKRQTMLQKVINGTGIMLHTNLGRAPLGRKVLGRVADMMSGYCNLEFHIPTERRGKRGGFCEELLCHFTGAEDALIVNNNASSVFLILSCFASGEEVIVSRGELLQIGGGFRIPDIMSETGATLREVGTTNITELDDYREAINESTAMIFSAHHSNFRISGFTRTPTPVELAGLKSESILMVRDLGSGNLVEDPRLPGPFEPTVQQELSYGPDLLCFSGDKLMGGCQAGIILGRKDLVTQLRKHPLMRMLRVDKFTYAILQEVLLRYDLKTHGDSGLWEMALQGRERVSARVSRFLRRLKSEHVKEAAHRVDTKAAFGGGSLPGIEIESAGIEIRMEGMGPAALYTYFLSCEPPVVGYVEGDRFIIDFMTVADDDVASIVMSLENLASVRTGR
jgi:L-seryl-tRNA(Ser) seleniumtransferase